MVCLWERTRAISMLKASGTDVGYYYATTVIPTRVNGRMTSATVLALPGIVLEMSTMESGNEADGTGMVSCTSRRGIRTLAVGRMA